MLVSEPFEDSKSGPYSALSWCRISSTISSGGWCNVDYESIGRLFEIGELAGQDVFVSEMALAGSQAIGDELVGTLQVDQFCIYASHEQIAVALFQRGAAEDRVAFFGIEFDEVSRAWRRATASGLRRSSGMP
jgi:hypothetical protein